MYLSQWYALGAFGTLMLLFWLIISPTERVYFTAGMSATAFSLMALTAPGVQKLTEQGTVVDAGIDVTVQLFVGILGILSLAVVFLYRLGEYPPPEEVDNE